ncbi:serine/threonine protein kinase [Catenulispora acidiphila DSM 44928]|uniref:Serine/threonine protein kinase n=1 Tax=Catenulispora acidiphila (strain DSM 44928 / JCM 14897 / NBRC 102108 / NRRL B-24433 / ID139908) TaxID=479433 RepID=C7QHA5_CATAD|nr:serine/threonine-protein kinase [Catenulispora acidiphila]ACU69044.1 serine/threonine protein kinase [Catenulispora acidiphila DSM 44928]
MTLDMNSDVHKGGSPATDRLGPYLLVTQLGSGAMGRVFLGTDSTGRQAAVKVVRSDLADIPAFRKRFSRELNVAERVHSPRVAEIYDAQTEGKRPWLATEYVPGPTLQDAVEQGGAFDNEHLRALAVAIAEALEVIHAAEVVHRDLKPANVLLGPDGPKVIDFGVARALDASLLTNTGQTLGTPAYMSPEQADGRAVESASDVFALGSLLVFAATGRLAFGDGAPLAILHRVVNNDPDLSGVAEDDEVLRGVIEGCLCKEPEDRPSPQQIKDTFGAIGWQPLTGVAWQQPPLGVGLPLTAGDAADLPTVAIAPKRGTKRVAVISAATVAALILATIAVVEASGGGKGNTAADTARTGGPTSSSQQNGGAFPSTDTSSGSTSSSGQTTPTSSSPPPPSQASGAPVPPGGGAGSTAPPQGSSQLVTVSVPITQGNGGSSQKPAPTSSHPTTHPSSAHTTSAAPPPPPTHNPPGPMVAGDISVLIPNWVGAATVNVSWKAHSDATSYAIHYTVKGTATNSDQTVPVSGTSYSYQIPADGTTCLQVRTVNQYGSSAFYPSPMYCVNSFGQVSSGG